ncbi:MAG: hypothetical protein ACO2PN_13840 [Pyrobaculum sp.]|jgi:hypothetical protein
MEEMHKERIVNREVEHVLEAFAKTVECVSRGTCDCAAHVVVSRHYVAFVAPNGEVRLINNGGLFVEVRTSCRLFTDSWDMFTLKNDKQRIYSPRLVVGNKVYTTDEFVDFVRRGFQSLLGAAGWV